MIFFNSIGSEESLQNRIKNADILRLVTAYREHGYKNADIDPLNTLKRWNLITLFPEL